MSDNNNNQNENKNQKIIFINLKILLI
jgi:hypothetical protein